MIPHKYEYYIPPNIRLQKTIDLLYIIWQKYEQNVIKIWRDRNYQYIHSNNLIKYNRK